ncbi:MAG: hypothetical protein FWG23_07975 [Eggerthellaceae bacterium]|jgi:CcmD family protein|nr:hypothetical protein [Eggerthellaceae bacterium]MDR2715424.1 hypothetical protein [Coriobacteriaceae bacterium]
MNPVLTEIYSTVLQAAPYVIGAYALIFLVLFVYVFIIMRGLKKTEQQMAVLEELLAEAGGAHK